MTTPDDVIDCWYVDEVERNRAQSIDRNYCEQYSTDDYFKIVKRLDAHYFEGHLGRKDLPLAFFNTIDRTYTYFSDYLNRKKVYFTFDKTVLFQVIHILPEKPLRILLKQIRPNPNRMIDQEAIYQLIYTEDWREIINILYAHRKDIPGDPLLQQAAATFEEVFFKKVALVSVDNEPIRDNLDIIYTLNHGGFYTLKPENFKTMIVEMVRRNPVKNAYNYALLFPEEEICKDIIERYQMDYNNQPKQSLERTSLNWTEIYNRTFELINQQDDAATYFSGPRFIKVVKAFYPYFPDYVQYIERRNQEGKSTSRKIFFYDILMELDEPSRLDIIEGILEIVRPFQPEKVMAIEMLVGKKSVDATVIASTEVPNAQPIHPIVFISYSWDDEAHKEWVLQLANRLRSNGIDVILDRYELGPGENLPHFVERSIQRANRIIIVFTPNYKLKADKRTGGVGYEYSIMNADLYRNQTTNEKIIPVIRTGTMEDSIPTFMQQFIHMDLSNNENFENSYTDLLREIFNEPATKRPEIGTKPKFEG